MPFLPWIQTSEQKKCEYTEADDFRITQVSEYLKNSPHDEIDPFEFRMACKACHVNPSSFTREDLELLKRKTEETAE